MQCVWEDLLPPEEAAEVLDEMQVMVRAEHQQLAASWASLIHLEARLIDVACVDPGRHVTSDVILLMIRERLELRAWKHENRHALQAQQQVCWCSWRVQTLQAIGLLGVKLDFSCFSSAFDGVLAM